MFNMFCIIAFTRGEKDRTVKKAREEYVFEKKDEIKQKHYCFFICNCKNQAKKTKYGIL